MALMTIVWSQWILAREITTSLNKSIDPCDNFYQFACGNYPSQVTMTDSEASMNAFVEADKILRRQMKLMFQEPSSPGDSRTYEMVKKYYRACMDTEALEKLALQPMKRMIGEYGGWPIVDGDGWNGTSYEWIERAAKTYRDFGMSRILLFNIKDDYKNTSKRIMEVDQPVLGMGKRDYYLNDNYSDILNAYRTYIYLTAVQLGAEESRAKRETDEIIDFETKIANITINQEKRRNFTELYNPMTVREMKRKYPRVPFDIWFSAMARNGWALSEDQIVDVVGAPYLEQLPDLLVGVKSRTLANYQLLSPILAMVPYLAPSLRDNYKKYRQSLYGSKEFKPRWEECVLIVRDDMDWPVSSMYVKEFFKPDAKDEVEAIVKYLSEAMKKTIAEATWMDDETKRRGQEKLDHMATKIAYPSYIFNESRIWQDFHGVEIEERRFFDNALSVSKATFNEDKRLLQEIHNRSEWSGGPAVVNAFYWAEQNSITFPAGILQHPFFVLNSPRYVNYARIGSVIGHEITHGYDDQGRQFDGEGRLDVWWTNETLQRYQDGTKCFINQYSQIKDEVTGLYVDCKIEPYGCLDDFYVVESSSNKIKFRPQQLNGELQLGENIADNGGVKLAYKAYHLWKDGHVLSDGSLPELSSMSNEQLFFIAYAQQWCDVIRPAYRSRIIITDPHAPSDYRVNVPLKNFPAFAEAFHCPKGSLMNPVQACVLW